jgi:tetraacyldisaccharide 4'-kinase
MHRLRLLLFPFSILYGCITFIRNKFFDWGIFEVYKIPLKSITIGNLSVGGTGKTPHVAFIVDFLKNNYKVAILSRGYGRKTKGYFQVNTSSTSEMVGDEPLFYFNNFNKDVSVVVCESRKQGVVEIEKTIHPKVIVLDDAFQHRKVKAGLSILLTEFSKPFYSDWMLPVGNLREFTSGKKRADFIVVTKCPENLSEKDKNNCIKKMNVSSSQVFFSKIVYGDVIRFDNQGVELFNQVLLVTGIANPFPLKESLEIDKKVELVAFPDHHDFSLSEIQKIHTKFDALENKNALILTTEKDYMRLKSQLSIQDLEKYPWCYVPITIDIDRKKEFLDEIINYVDTI